MKPSKRKKYERFKRTAYLREFRTHCIPIDHPIVQQAYLNTLKCGEWNTITGVRFIQCENPFSSENTDR